MKKEYKNKMIEPDNKSIRLIPKYIGGVELDFPRYKKRVKHGDLLPELPITEANNRDDFILVKEK
jgi:hypothetical protein